jgi:sugar transferase (PEP-CTERM/EpsH1 system associated)
MKILFLCHRIPYPPNKGDKLRAFNIIKYLSKEHKIYLVSLYDNKEDKNYIPSLKQFCKESSFFYLNPWLARIKGFFFLLFNQPISLGYFYSHKMKRRVRGLIKTRELDLAYVYSSSMAQYVMNEDRKKIMDFVDCDSAKWGQYSKFSGFPLSWVYKREQNLLEAYEKKITQNFDRFIVATEGEKKEFSRFLETDKFIVLHNGVDTDFFRQVLQTQAKNLIFTGEMNYFANIDGVIYFCKEVLPIIRKKFPEVKFYIVGRNPTHSVRALSRMEGIFVTGFVEDTREYFKNSAISIVPLRIAQGVQNKVLEAMASGLSVVTTSKAISGLKPQADKNVLVADNPQDFANKVIMLLEDSDVRRRLGEGARRYVEENYNWERNLSELKELIRLS